MDGCLSRSEIDQFLRGGLTDDARAFVESHLESCASCHDAVVDREIDEFIPAARAAVASSSSSSPDEKRVVGSYRLIRELGRGGQANVYLAEDTRLPRRVALKVFQSGFAASQAALHRFQREAAALSRLDHPGICTVYETGEWEGRPFIAMRYVEGETLAQRIAGRTEASRRGQSSSREAALQEIALLERAARALHTAHEAGLVHRDIKPSNIIISRDGEPLILDFGLARDAESADLTLTRTGDLTGTPAYMSPEQVRGERELIDRRSDVFSLGVSLYEALTLTLPFDAPTTAGVFQRILLGSLPDPSRASHHVSRDLKVILETALERDRSRRYQTSLALAEDLRRYREHETILARPAGPALRLRRWTQRNPVIAVSLLAVFLVLATALGISLALLGRIRVESAVRAAALKREEGLRLAFQSSAVLRDNPGQALRLAVEAAQRARSPAANSALIEALEGCHERAVLLGHQGSLECVAFNPDASRALTASMDGTARVWDATSGKMLLTLAGHRATVVTAEYSPDGRRILTAAEDATATIWDASSGAAIVKLLGHEHGLVLARFSPDGALALTVGQNSARLWDASTGKFLRVLAHRDAAIVCARFSPDGTRVVTGSADRTAIIWDAGSAKMLFLLTGHEAAIVDARWSGDGKRVITGSVDATARVWDASNGQLVSVLKGHKDVVYSAALGPNGEIAATGDEDFTARIWNASTGAQLFVLRHEHKVIYMELSRDGRRLLTASYDRTARVWDTATGEPIATFKGHAAPLVHAAFSSDGERAVTCSVDRTARVWSIHSPEPVEAVPRRDGYVDQAHVDPAGRFVAVVSSGRQEAVDILTFSSGARRASLLGHRDAILAFELSRDGRQALTASKDATARLWSTETGELLLELAGHEAALSSARFSFDGSKVITASRDRTARIWDARTGASLATIGGHKSPLVSASLSPDGRRVLSGAEDGEIRVTEIESGRAASFDHEKSPYFKSAEWSPDGSRFVTSAFTQRVRVWSASDQTSVGALVHSARAVLAAFSPDGRWIATVCEDRIVRIWDSATYQETLHLKEDGYSGASFGFISDGKRVVVLYWCVAAGHSPESRLLVYPLDPLNEALEWRPGVLTPDERDQFEVGSTAERAAFRDHWRGNAPESLH